MGFNNATEWNAELRMCSHVGSVLFLDVPVEQSVMVGPIIHMHGQKQSSILSGMGTRVVLIEIDCKALTRRFAKSCLLSSR